MTNIFVDTEGNKFEGIDFFDHEKQQWLIALAPLVQKELNPEWEANYIYSDEASSVPSGFDVTIQGHSTELALIKHCMHDLLALLYTDDPLNGKDMMEFQTRLIDKRKEIQNYKAARQQP